MTTEYLLRKINNKSASFDYKLIQEAYCFKEKIYNNSLESIALVLDGHQAIFKMVFSTKMLDDWCNQFNIIYYFDEYERVYHFTYRPSLI